MPDSLFVDGFGDLSSWTFRGLQSHLRSYIFVIWITTCFSAVSQSGNLWKNEQDEQEVRSLRRLESLSW
jgi:hypothetical protein